MKKNTFVGLLTVIFCSCLVRSCLAYFDVEINVPQAVIKGKDATLACNFDVDADSLYSVKWYHGGYEFYRYTPKEDDPVKLFPLKGIVVREDKSSESTVVLANVSREISGTFICEVTADSPSFYTSLKAADMQVVEPPRREPIMTNFKKRYTNLEENRHFRAECISEHSYPAPNMTWFINGHKIKPEKHILNRRLNQGRHFKVISVLRLPLQEKYFQNGKMKVRCAAWIYNVYFQAVEHTVELLDKLKKGTYNIDLYPTTTTARPHSIENFNENSQIRPYWTPGHKHEQSPPMWGIPDEDEENNRGEADPYFELLPTEDPNNLYLNNSDSNSTAPYPFSKDMMMLGMSVNIVVLYFIR